MMNTFREIKENIATEKTFVDFHSMTTSYASSLSGTLI